MLHGRGVLIRALERPRAPPALSLNYYGETIILTDGALLMISAFLARGGLRLAASGLILIIAIAPYPSLAQLPARPPIAAVHPVTDDYFGAKIVDPYRWMEALDAPTIEWMKAQGAYTRAVFDSIPPRRAYLKTASAFSGAFGLLTTVQVYGGRTFFLNRAPGSDSYDLMVRDAAGAEAKLVDVAALSAAHAGAPYAINYYQASPDGRLVAVGV